MEAICPNSNVCNRTSTTSANVSAQEENNSCCMSCSCTVNCHEEPEGCCFNDGHSDLSTQYGACLKPLVGDPEIIDLPKYTFVMKPPIGGCDSYQDDNVNQSACSSDAMVGPWGDFAPVYSKSLKANFKNVQCALCHGADPESIKEWTPSLYSTARMSLQFVPSFIDFNEGSFSSHLAAVFYPPNKESESKRCYEMMNECLPTSKVDQFLTQSTVQLDSATVIDACKRGPQALYRRNRTHAYKNVFCSMCSETRWENDGAISCTDDDDVKSNHPSFIALIDSKYLQTAQAYADGENKKDPEVCYRTGNLPNDTRCEQSFCPALQVRETSGKCVFPITKMFLDCFRVSVVLSAAHGTDTSSILGFDSSRLLDLFDEQKPWPATWQIGYVGAVTVGDSTEFYIELTFKTGRRQIDIRALIRAIERLLAKPWNVGTDDGVVFTQSFPTYYTRDRLTTLLFQLHVYQKGCLEINKLFYCEQIELNPSEYRRESQALHLVHSGEILDNSAYIVFTMDEAVKRVRVCVEDSGYMMVRSVGHTLHVFCGGVMMLFVFHLYMKALFITMYLVL